mmetsp:Transcript_18759/g.53005  ORF Transcript_18759/g.53005 Transcript_18759/m.53005 type:complete len:224 (-) Transcript_18759:309-980(-)
MALLPLGADEAAVPVAVPHDGRPELKPLSVQAVGAQKARLVVGQQLYGPLVHVGPEQLAIPMELVDKDGSVDLRKLLQPVALPHVNVQGRLDAWDHAPSAGEDVMHDLGVKVRTLVDAEDGVDQGSLLLRREGVLVLVERLEHGLTVGDSGHGRLQLLDEDAEIDLCLHGVEEAAHRHDVQQHVCTKCFDAVGQVFDAVGDLLHALGEVLGHLLQRLLHVPDL